MRRLKTLWRSALSPRVCEELETWIGVLLALGAAVLLFVTLKTQAAYASPPRAAEAAQLEPTMAAPGMPPESTVQPRARAQWRAA